MSGAVGTLLRTHDGGDDIVPVEWDNFEEGHHCDGLLPIDGPASGWYVYMREIEPITEEHEGDKTSATACHEGTTEGVKGGSPASGTDAAGSAATRNDP